MYDQDQEGNRFHQLPVEETTFEADFTQVSAQINLQTIQKYLH